MTDKPIHIKLDNYKTDAHCVIGSVISPDIALIEVIIILDIKTMHHYS